jgi:hypothetical protein
MKRTLLNMLTLLTLLPFFGTLALCLFSAEWQFTLRDAGGGIAGGSDVATVVVFVDQGSFGLGWTHSDVWFENSIRVPLWLLAYLTAVVPLWRLFRWKYPSKPPRDTCRTCPYDLRAHINGAADDKCPECGTPFP